VEYIILLPHTTEEQELRLQLTAQLTFLLVVVVDLNIVLAQAAQAA
jgi:hypothetical protein